MGDDPDRDAILRRRNRFIALALSGLTGAVGCDEVVPGPCLEAPIEQTDPPPGPCLEAPIPVQGRRPQPTPCLSGAPTAPQPCLEMPAPPDEETEDAPEGDHEGSDTGGDPDDESEGAFSGRPSSGGGLIGPCLIFGEH